MGPIDKLREKLAIGQVEKKMSAESPSESASDRPQPKQADSFASAPGMMQHANTFDSPRNRPSPTSSSANSTRSGITPVKKSQTFNDERSYTAAWGSAVKPLSSQNSFGSGVKATGEYGGAFGHGIKPLKIDPSLGFGSGIKPSSQKSSRQPSRRTSSN